MPVPAAYGHLWKILDSADFMFIKPILYRFSLMHLAFIGKEGNLKVFEEPEIEFERFDEKFYSERVIAQNPLSSQEYLWQAKFRHKLLQQSL